MDDVVGCTWYDLLAKDAKDVKRAKTIINIRYV